MTKHRTISQQQLHNDVRLVFPRNNCLLKLAALLPALQMPASRRRAASSAAFVLCVYVVHTHRCALVCVCLCACTRRCVRALCSIHSNVQREISFQYATRSATRRGLRLRLCRSRRRRRRSRSWLWVRYKSISIGLSVFVGKKRRTVHTLSASRRRRRNILQKSFRARANSNGNIARSFKLCVC